MKDFTRIKNIIFDLGAVIIPIDFSLTFRAFASLSNLPLEEIQSKYQASTIFVEFEKGIIGNFQFLVGVRQLLELSDSITDQQLVDAWNALLLEIPAERVHRIQELSKQYRVFLLSNTNPIHIAEVQSILYRNTQIAQLEAIFEKAWYSYDLGLIKPGKAIYQKVLEQKQLAAAETIFLDDSVDNVAGAVAAGIQALLVDEHTSLLELLKHA